MLINHNMMVSNDHNQQQLSASSLLVCFIFSLVQCPYLVVLQQRVVYFRHVYDFKYYEHIKTQTNKNLIRAWMANCVVYSRVSTKASNSIGSVVRSDWNLLLIKRYVTIVCINNKFQKLFTQESALSAKARVYFQTYLGDDIGKPAEPSAVGLVGHILRQLVVHRKS